MRPCSDPICWIHICILSTYHLPQHILGAQWTFTDLMSTLFPFPNYFLSYKNSFSNFNTEVCACIFNFTYILLYLHIYIFFSIRLWVFQRYNLCFIHLFIPKPNRVLDTENFTVQWVLISENVLKVWLTNGKFYRYKNLK